MLSAASLHSSTEVIDFPGGHPSVASCKTSCRGGGVVGVRLGDTVGAVGFGLGADVGQSVTNIVLLQIERQEPSFCSGPHKLKFESK